MVKATHPTIETSCWTSLKKGDSAALGYLYDTYIDKLFLAALRITDNRELAKDALQEVFIQIWNYRDTIGDVTHTQAYLVRILRNILIKKLKAEHQTGPQAIGDTIACPDGNREETIIMSDTDKELDFRLNSALANLTSRQRLILQLHFYEGLSYEQIAVRLSMNYQSVNNLAFRTIRHLRNLMCVVVVIVEMSL
jgi:RNA polymerase sigma factor (sigma-70 family)